MVRRRPGQAMGARVGATLVCASLLALGGACGKSDGSAESVLGTANDEGLDTGLVSGASSEDEEGEATSLETDSTAGPKLDIAVDSTGTDGTDTSGDCNQDVDIVFVMDVSTTMGPFLDKLETEINVVDAALNAFNLPSPPQYGLVVFVDDVLISNAGQPYTDVNQLRADFEMWNAHTSTNQQVASGGSNSTWHENSLDALFLASSAFAWRPADSTLRMIIHTTDDTFWDGPTTGNGVMIEHGYADTVARLQSDQVRVFSFAGLIGGSCNCDDVSPGWSTPYMGMAPIPEATGGAAWNIDEVLSDTISLSASIDQAVEDTMCVPYPPPD